MADAPTPDPAGAAALVDAIRHTHGARATFVRWERVTDSHDGRVMVDRTVGVFSLSGHDAATAYAWSEPGRSSPTARRFFAVLHWPPVASPLDAVRASIAKDAGR